MENDRMLNKHQQLKTRMENYGFALPPKDFDRGDTFDHKIAFDKTNKYASNGQDLLAYELLGKDKYFVDVGAGNGLHGSNTVKLEKEYGWTGICIEAHPYHLPMLTNIRDCICSHCVISDKKGTSNFCYDEVNHGPLWKGREMGWPSKKDADVKIEHPTYHAYGGGSGLASSHHMSPEKLSNAYTQPVMTVTLDSVLKECDSPKHIDFLDIDVEGAEFKVLKGINWEDTSFGLINIQTDGNSKIHNFLEQKGYVFWQNIGQDTMFKSC